MSKTGDSQERYLTFSLGTDRYGIPLLSVKEVLAMPEIKAVPETPAYFLGLMNLRGQIVPVVDMRTKLGLKPTARTEATVIISDCGDSVIGVVVDSVDSVIAPSAEDISAAPEMANRKNAAYLKGVCRQGDALLLFLDLPALLNVDEKNVIQTKTKIAA